MIQTLHTFSRKSFKNYSLPSSISFKDKNIIFGYNGRGKSSLADEINDEFKKTQPSDSVRYFNRYFIQDNLSVEDSNALKGVIAIFGKKDNDTKSKIAELKNKIQDEKLPQKEIANLKKSIRGSIDSIVDSKKGTLSIAKKSTTYKGRERTISEIIGMYQSDYDEALKIESDKDKFISMIGDDKAEREKRLLEAVSIPDLSFQVLDKNTLADYNAILNENYLDIGIPNSTVIKWLEQGVSLHEKENSKEKCLFCNQAIDFSYIENQVADYGKNEKQQAEIKIKSFMDLITTWQDKVMLLDEKLTDYELYFNKNELDALYQKIAIEKANLQDFYTIFDSKLGFMEAKKDILDTEKLLNIISSVNKLNKQFSTLKTTQLDKIQIRINKQNELVKGAIGFAVISNGTIKETVSELSEKENELNKIMSDNQALNMRIRSLESIDSNYEDFRQFLNIVLSDIEIDLMLELGEDNKTYILKHSKTNDALTIGNISEGEKNLLALLFFYYELFDDDKQEQLKAEISLILIDDPISSLDDANKFYVLELMKKVLDGRAQIFILTHSWNDYCQLCFKYQAGSSDTVEFLEVYKDSSSHSNIKRLSSIEKPYKQLFQEIDEFSKKDANYTPNAAEIYHIPNSMRRIFEEFLHFKSSKDFIPTRIKAPEIADIIISSTDNRKIDGNSCENGSYLSTNKKTKLEQLLDITNVLSHEASHNPTEILSSSKFLMKLIKDMDPSHYNAMKKQ